MNLRKSVKFWQTERQDWEDAVPHIYSKIVASVIGLLMTQPLLMRRIKKFWQQSAMRKESLSLLRKIG